VRRCFHSGPSQNGIPPPESGLCVGRKRIARLVREAGLAGVSRRRGGSHHAPRSAGPPGAGPGQPSVHGRCSRSPLAGGHHHVPTAQGFLYLAIVLDVFSRRIVGWSMASNRHTELVLDALEMALSQRRPQGIVHHSDQGSHYTSLAFSRRCREAGVLPSMGKAGDCFDNAMAESFFASRECELIDPHALPRPRPRQEGTLPLDRRLVEPPSATLRDRTPLARQLREELPRSPLSP